MNVNLSSFVTSSFVFLCDMMVDVVVLILSVFVKQTELRVRYVLI